MWLFQCSLDSANLCVEQCNHPRPFIQVAVIIIFSKVLLKQRKKLLKGTVQLLTVSISTAVDPQAKSKDHSLPDMDFVRHQQGTLTPEMDIFSAG